MIMSVSITRRYPRLSNGSPELEAEIRARVRDLVGARPLQFMRQLIGAWCIITVAISLAIWLDNVWMSLIAIFLVATRQNLLGLLVHEQVHRLGSRGPYGDLLTNLFAAYPLLVLTVEGYAQVHLAHHKYFYTGKDPDYARKSGPEWSIPMSRGQFARLFLHDILGLNILRLIRSKKADTSGARDEFRRRHPTPQWVRPTYWIIAVGALTYSGGWAYFLLYWVLPDYRRSVFGSARRAERAQYNVNSTELNDSTHLIELSWWERLLLPNMNFTLHHYHHMYPGVSFATLPLVHQMYKEANLVHQENILQGYGDFIRRRYWANKHSPATPAIGVRSAPRRA